MPRDSWQEAVSDIREATGPVTSKQQQLASAAGKELSQEMPRLVASARLRAELSAELGLSSAPSSTVEQLELIAELGTAGDFQPQDGWEASAWIRYLLLKKREQALERLKVEAGDIVEAVDSPGDEQLDEVSSIGSDGRLYFKGGAGAGAWPDKVTVRCRRRDNSAGARRLKQIAANRAAHRSRVDSWSCAKQHELQEFVATTGLTLYDVEQLEAVIASADDEEPIQRFIESCPQILTALPGGVQRFCLPDVSFGGKYVADFLNSDTDSLGIRWILVEFETPNSSITLKSHNELDKHARKGVSQIREWREWVQNNLNFARKPKREDGLGLVDIRPESQGLVLVGAEKCCMTTQVLCDIEFARRATSGCRHTTGCSTNSTGS
jgi:hypothetical protein